MRDVDGDEAVHFAHLHGGKADARRCVHGFEHVLGELANAVVDWRWALTPGEAAGGEDDEGTC
jgi:hypothetical protein